MKILRKKREFHWTKHIRKKMRQYRISEKRALRIFYRPERKEVGVAENTIAAMQKTGSKKYPSEIWIMFQERKNKIIMISTWRYPGVSPVRQPPPIPQEVLENLEEILKE